MSVRVSTLTLVVVAAAGAVATVGLWRIPLRSRPNKPSFKPTRTSWGDPDLQGVWDYRTITPLERRPSSATASTTRTRRSRSSRAARRSGSTRRPTRRCRPVSCTQTISPIPGRHVDESRRTSLIVDPKTRPDSAADAGGEAAPRQSRGAPGTCRRGSSACGRTRRLVSRSTALRALHHARPAGDDPADALQQQHPDQQSPGYVAIVHEMIHETRVVPLGGSFGHVRSYLGESRGHFEGDTLVIETRNFNGKAGFRGSRREPRVDRALHEGRRRQDRLPTHVRRPHAVDAAVDRRVLHARRAKASMYEYACHEGNYGLRNILQEARDAERDAAAKR